MKKILIFSAIVMAFASCVGDDLLDDFVGQSIRITSAIDSIEVNTTFQFDKMYLNDVGQEEDVEVVWGSTDTNILQIDQNGLATAIEKGTAIVYVEFQSNDAIVTDSVQVEVGESTVIITNRQIEGEIRTTTFYDLEGSFIYREDGDNIILDIGPNYVASRGLPGFYIYLSNNRNSIAGAFEIGEVTTFRGAHSYTIEGVGFEDYAHIVYFCKPFNVKIGDADLNF